MKVRLTIADLAPLDAVVDELGENAAIVGLVDEPPVPLTDIGPIEASVEGTTVRGLTRLVGTLRQHGQSTIQCRIDFDEGPQVIQRRQFVRVHTETPVAVVRPDGSRHQTRTVNLSGSGLLLAGPAELELDEQIVMNIEIGRGEMPVHVRGQVVRETSRGEKGVRLALIEEGDRERLIHFVFERQRTAPRVRV